jgi:hypothetical protein
MAKRTGRQVKGRSARATRTNPALRGGMARALGLHVTALLMAVSFPLHLGRAPSVIRGYRENPNGTADDP